MSCTLGTPTVADEEVRCDRQPNNSYEMAITSTEIDVAAKPILRSYCTIVNDD